jgi:hypothetical protein
MMNEQVALHLAIVRGGLQRLIDDAENIGLVLRPKVVIPDESAEGAAETLYQMSKDLDDDTATLYAEYKDNASDMMEHGTAMSLGMTIVDSYKDSPVGQPIKRTALMKQAAEYAASWICLRNIRLRTALEGIIDYTSKGQLFVANGGIEDMRDLGKSLVARRAELLMRLDRIVLISAFLNEYRNLRCSLSSQEEGTDDQIEVAS